MKRMMNHSEVITLKLFKETVKQSKRYHVFIGKTSSSNTILNLSTRILNKVEQTQTKLAA